MTFTDPDGRDVTSCFVSDGNRFCVLSPVVLGEFSFEDSEVEANFKLKTPIALVCGEEYELKISVNPPEDFSKWTGKNGNA